MDTAIIAVLISLFGTGGLTVLMLILKASNAASRELGGINSKNLQQDNELVRLGKAKHDHANILHQHEGRITRLEEKV